jgi:NCS1 family nucleobase:cation symporter-1
MNWWQAVLTIFLGNTIVLVPMVLNAHAGTKYGIPFPVYCRASFGMLGANVPASSAPSWPAAGSASRRGSAAGPSTRSSRSTSRAGRPLPKLGVARHQPPQLVCFLFFWGLNMLGHPQGHRVDPRPAQHQGAAPHRARPRAARVGVPRAGGFGPMLDTPSAFDVGQPKRASSGAFFFPALTGMVGFWATLSLNIPDFTRYAYLAARSGVGQASGCPPRWGSSRSSASPSPRPR